VSVVRALRGSRASGFRSVPGSNRGSTVVATGDRAAATQAAAAAVARLGAEAGLRTLA